MVHIYRLIPFSMFIYSGLVQIPRIIYLETSVRKGAPLASTDSPSGRALGSHQAQGTQAATRPVGARGLQISATQTAVIVSERLGIGLGSSQVLARCLAVFCLWPALGSAGGWWGVGAPRGSLDNTGLSCAAMSCPV